MLTRVNTESDAEGKVAAYYEGVSSALAACKRLADSVSDVASGGSAEPGWAEAEALELDRLRRDLAATKVVLAESEAKREALEHSLRATAERKSRPSIFG